MTPPSHLVNGFNPETRKLLDNGVMDLQEKKTLCQIMRGKKSDFKGREKHVRKKNATL